MCERCDGAGAHHPTRRQALQVLGAAAIAAVTWPARQAAGAPIGDIEVAPGLRIRPRAAWAGDLQPTGPIGPEDVRFLLVHHTATATDHRPHEVPGILRSIYRFHTGPDKGWPDVCYHWFVDAAGTVWEGRAGSLDGPVLADATAGNQGFAQLVCLIGDFTSVMPTPAAQAALVRVLAWLADRYGVDTTPGATTEFVSRGSNLWPAGTPVVASTISGHRDMSATGCPGDTFYPVLVRDVPTLVSAHRRPGPAPAPPPPPAAPRTTAQPPPPPPTSTSPPPAPTATSTSTTARATPSTTTSPSTSAPTTSTTAAPGDDRPASVPPTAGTALIAVGPTPAPETSGPGAKPWLIGGSAAVATAGAAAMLAAWLHAGRSPAPPDPSDLEPGSG